MSAKCWRRVQPFTRSVGRLLDQPRKYLRQERQVKRNEIRSLGTFCSLAEPNSRRRQSDRPAISGGLSPLGAARNRSSAQKLTIGAWGRLRHHGATANEYRERSANEARAVYLARASTWVMASISWRCTKFRHHGCRRLDQRDFCAAVSRGGTMACRCETDRARIIGDDEILLARRPVSPFTSRDTP